MSNIIKQPTKVNVPIRNGNNSSNSNNNSQPVRVTTTTLTTTTKRSEFTKEINDIKKNK